MRYKGKTDRITRELMRLFEVDIYDGDPDDPKTKTIKETIIAWNATDAIRRCGSRKVALPPVAMHHVTHPSLEGGAVYKIESTAGPTDDLEIKPSIETNPSKSDEKMVMDKAIRDAEAKTKRKAKAKAKAEAEDES